MDYEPSSNLRQRQGVWYMDMRIGGHRVRKSTNTSDIEKARQFVKVYEMQFRGKVLDKTWGEKVELDAQNPRSWIRQMHKGVLLRSKKSGRDHDLSFAALVGLVIATNGKCEVSGIRFDWTKPEHARSAPFAPSIDRINSRLGYVAGNCRIVCLSVNMGMREWGEAVMTKIGLAMLAKKLEQEI